MNVKDINLLSDKELLNTPLSQLEFNINSSHIIRSINDLKYELNLKKINFIPKIWVSTDWFSPDGHAGFAIPFYLFHPKLIQLQKTFVGRVEGTTEKSIIKLLRHETGHALDNAFELRRKKMRQALFGLSKQTYPTSYIPNPNSKNYVRNLDEFYAQSHPDEDWAETFSVWLDPHSNWERKYKDWPAISKLNYLNDIFSSLHHTKPKDLKCSEIDSVKDDHRTIQEYLIEKRLEVHPYKKPIRLKFQKELANFIIKKPNESKRTIQEITQNSFVTKKVIQTILTGEMTESSRLKSSKQAEFALVAATKSIIRAGRHKVFM